MIAEAAKKILIVEDDEDTAGPMANALDRLGYHVVAVLSSAEEAIEKAAANPPDLVIMDVILKGTLDGIQAGRHLEDRLGLPVVYITGYLDKAGILEGEGRVPLLKPFTMEDLQTAIGVIFYRIASKAKRQAPRPSQTKAQQNPSS